MSNWILYSDGGAELNKSAAAACILEETATGKRTHIVSYLGAGTNNEAEIFAGLQGFAYILSEGHSSANIQWISDSQYALKSACEYIFNWQKNGWKTSSKKEVKNQGLWKLFLELTRSFKIKPEHVYGHTGHIENEFCDQATNWLRANIDSVLLPDQRATTQTLNQAPWFIFDGQKIIEQCREELSTKQSFQELVSVFDESDFDNPSAATRELLSDAKIVSPQFAECIEKALKLCPEKDKVSRKKLHSILEKYGK